MMIVERYRPVLLMQYLLLCVDVFMNSFTELLRFQNVVLLVLYVIQDCCLMFAVIIIFLLFFSTFIFQAGLISILVSKFKMAISITFIYLALCLALHIWTMNLRWGDVNAYIWDNKGYHVLFAFQRIAAYCGVIYHMELSTYGNVLSAVMSVLNSTQLISSEVNRIPCLMQEFSLSLSFHMMGKFKTAVFYYYFYKRTALKLGEPHFYEDSEWIHKEFERRR